MIFPGFIDGTNETFSTIGDVQRTVNLYPVLIGPSGKNSKALAGTPGLVTQFNLASKSSVRGMFHGNLYGTGYFYTAIDDHLYKVKSDGSTSADQGAIASSTSLIKWATGGSGQDTVIVSGATAYSLVSGTLAAISDLSAETVLCCASINNFWIVGLADGRFRISALNDPTSWDALDFEVADDSSEPVNGIIISNSQVWFLGNTRANVWFYSGNSSFPFEQMKGAQIRYGLQAPDSLAIADNAITWLAQNNDGQNMVVSARGYAPQRISTPAVENLISALSVRSDARGFCYTEDGHTFYVLNFPTGDLTLVYDFLMQQWHERQTDGHAHPAQCHLMDGGLHLVGSRSDGTIYSMSRNALDDAGVSIQRLRRCPHLGQENKKIRYTRLELDLEKGLAPIGGDSLMYLRWSDDGGKTWGAPVSASIGEVGDYSRQVAWGRLGYGQDRVFELYSTSPIKHCWINAFLELGK